eukprot:4813014-Amphidinium_carterae.1
MGWIHEQNPNVFLCCRGSVLLAGRYNLRFCTVDLEHPTYYSRKCYDKMVECYSVQLHAIFI